MALGLDDLLGGVLGAAIIFVLTVIYGESGMLRRHARERTGLSRLLNSEIERNEASLLALRDNVNDANPLLAIDAWSDARVRIAQLVRKKDFDPLADYYEELQTLLNLLESGRYHPSVVREQAPGIAEDLLQRGTTAKNSIQRFAEPSWHERVLGT